jgi:hypothetical protein
VGPTINLKTALNFLKTRVKIRVLCGWVSFRKNPSGIIIPLGCQTVH